MGGRSVINEHDWLWQRRVHINCLHKSQREVSWFAQTHALAKILTRLGHMDAVMQPILGHKRPDIPSPPPPLIPHMFVGWGRLFVSLAFWSFCKYLGVDPIPLTVSFLWFFWCVQKTGVFGPQILFLVLWGCFVIGLKCSYLLTISAPGAEPSSFSLTVSLTVIFFVDFPT